MAISDDTNLQDLNIFPDDFMSQLRDFGVTTVGELLGATRGFLQLPSSDPAWLGYCQSVQALVGLERVLAYQSVLALPATGLRPRP